MLSFERRVVDALTADLDPARRSAVATYVDESLRAMPEHLRAGVAGESLLLGLWAGLRTAVSPHRRPAGVSIAALDAHPVGLVRQYVRLLRSLVLYAQCELPAAAR